MIDFALGVLVGVLATLGVYHQPRPKEPPRGRKREETGVVKGDGEGDEVFVLD